MVYTTFAVIIWVVLTERGVVENMLLGRIFGLERQEVKGGWKRYC